MVGVPEPDDLGWTGFAGDGLEAGLPPDAPLESDPSFFDCTPAPLPVTVLFVGLLKGDEVSPIFPLLLRAAETTGEGFPLDEEVVVLLLSSE